MGRRVATGILALSLAAAAWGLAGAAPSSPVATPAASPAPCPITAPNGVQPPPDALVFGRGAGDFGNGALWTALWMWGEGEIRVDPGHVQPDGSLGPMKWAWYRSVPGPLTVEGRRLDAPAPPPGGVRAGRRPARPAGGDPGRLRGPLPRRGLHPYRAGLPQRGVLGGRGARRRSAPDLRHPRGQGGPPPALGA